MAHQGSGQAREPGSYPSPSAQSSYSSPTHPYAYPPPNQGQNTEYRASPTDSNNSLPPINLPSLPSIRTIDSVPSPQQGQQTRHPDGQQHPGSQPAMANPLPPPMPQYYQGMSAHAMPHAPHLSVTSDPQQAMRYPIPPQDTRMMSGGRHKKEIKRRTKTGCLTCRKRRIKVWQHLRNAPCEFLSPCPLGQKEWWFAFAEFFLLRVAIG